MDSPIQTAEKAILASAMSTRILSAVVDAVMESHNLKQAIWEQFKRNHQGCSQAELNVIG